jgi:hypothetical protein
MAEVTPERVKTMAAAARIAVADDGAARIARAVNSTVARYAAGSIAIPLEIEPASFIVVQCKDAAGD